MLKNKVQLGNTMGDCFEDESGIISYYLDEYLKRKKTLFTFSLKIKFGFLSLSSGLSSVCSVAFNNSAVYPYTGGFVPMVNFFFHLLS